MNADDVDEKAFECLGMDVAHESCPVIATFMTLSWGLAVFRWLALGVDLAFVYQTGLACPCLGEKECLGRLEGDWRLVWVGREKSETGYMRNLLIHISSLT